MIAGSCREIDAIDSPLGWKTQFQRIDWSLIAKTDPFNLEGDCVKTSKVKKFSAPNQTVESVEKAGTFFAMVYKLVDAKYV